MAIKARVTQRQAEYVCPVCKHPVATEIQRHKTLGIFVPVWGPGPCHNPDCPAHEEEPQQESDQKSAAGQSAPADSQPRGGRTT